MSAPILLRRDFDASQLRRLAKKTKDGPQARRFLALAAIYDAASRTEAAKTGGVGLQIIRDWVLHLNERGHVVPLALDHRCRQLTCLGQRLADKWR